MKNSIITFIILGIVFMGCKKTPSEVNPIEDNYMSLHVGDIRQFYLTKSTDTSFALWKITGKTLRSDGQEVFISEWFINNLDSSRMYYTHEFIRGGYYYATGMDSTSGYPGNPYLEEKLAPVNPSDGETFIQIAGVNNPDTSQDYNTVKDLGEFDTPAGKFENVYNIIGIRGASSIQVNTYYAKNWGYLGIEYINPHSDSSNLSSIVNYMKINGQEIGKYVDMSKLPSKKYYFKSKQTMIINLNGSTLK